MNLDALVCWLKEKLCVWEDRVLKQFEPALLALDVPDSLLREFSHPAPALAAALRAAHCSLDILLRRLEPEELALAVQIDFLGRKAFHELLRERFWLKMSIWLGKLRSDPVTAEEIVQEV